MMGLSYESEPALRKLETHFPGRLKFRYIMSGLVRDVSDVMTIAELALEPEEGIRRYNRRLAKIYEEEESIAGLPMDMRDLHLFDTGHRSSFPLDIAYKASQLADPEKADAFLYRLRYATIVESRQTTRDEEIRRAAAETGISLKAFDQYYFSGTAEQAFEKDKELTASLGIHGLPSCVVCYGGGGKQDSYRDWHAMKI